MDSPDGSWIRTCAVSDVPDDEGYRVESTPPVAVFRCEDEVFCIDDTCTHEEFSLAEGWVEDCVVECSLHMARYDLRTGKSLGPPANGPVAVHAARVEGGVVFVKLPESYAPPEEG